MKGNEIEKNIVQIWKKKIIQCRHIHALGVKIPREIWGTIQTKHKQGEYIRAVWGPE